MSRKGTQAPTVRALAAATAEKMIGHLLTGPTFGPEAMDSSDIDAAIISVAQAIADEDGLERGPDYDDHVLCAERDAAYMIGVQVGLRLRGVR